MAIGRFCWYDLMTTDPAAGKNFYTGVLGWGTEKWENEGGVDYNMWSTERGPIGGVTQLSEEAVAAGAPPHWLAYVEVDDVAGTLAKAEQLGASVMVAATPIDDAGEFAVFADPQGATLALYRSNHGAGEFQPPRTGDFSWHELMTTDYEAALAFYSDLFGWEGTELHEMGPGANYQIFGQPGNPMPLGGMFNITQEMQAQPAWGYYVTVDSLDATLDKVRNQGGTVIVGPMEVPGGDRIAQCTDPQGAFFALHELASANS